MSGVGDQFLSIREAGNPKNEVGQEGHETLKYSLLGPSLLKAGQEAVDQSKVRLFKGMAI